MVYEKIDFLEVEFDTFVVGCKLPKEIVEKDALISEKLGLDVEILKREVNREMGKLLEKNLPQEVDFDKEDVIIMADFRKMLKEDVEKQACQKHSPDKMAMQEMQRQRMRGLQLHRKAVS